MGVVAVVIALAASCGREPSHEILPGWTNQMRRVDGAVFKMGNEEDRTAHTVYVGDFHLSQYEITVGEFRAFVEATGYQTEAERDGSARVYASTGDAGGWNDTRGVNWRRPGYEQSDAHPVTCVSWNDAVAFCDWLSSQTGLPYRLPTEAEWEFAAQSRIAGSAYSWGDAAPDGTQGNLADASAPWDWSDTTINDGFATAAPVGSYPANVFGLYDMSGNVWEWCQDWYAPYSTEAQQNPTGPDSGAGRVMRGGSYMNESKALRTRFRNYDAPSARYNNLGFRVCHSEE